MHPRSRGGRHSGPGFGNPRSHLRRPPGPLCPAHLVPRPAAGKGGECSGVRVAPADADHQAERSASGRCQPRYVLLPFYRGAAPPHPSVATFVATPGNMMMSPSIKHGLRLSAGCCSLATSLEPFSTPSVPSHSSTLRGTALDRAFHLTRETRGPRCQEPDNGGHESCGHEWTMPHSGHCDKQ